MRKATSASEEVEFRDALTVVADQHFQAMLGLSGDELQEYTRAVIADHAVVIGVYPDQSQPADVGLFVIKGREKVTRDGPVDYRWTAIPCFSDEVAEIAREKWGDGALQ